MRKSRRNRLLKIAGGTLAVVAVLGSGLWFGHTRMEGLRSTIGELTHTVEEQKSRMVRVLCIGRDLLPGERITAEDIYTAEVPEDALPADCVAAASELEGRILRIPVMKGAYITAGMLVGEAPKDDERELRYSCIKYDHLTGPGDCIDVRIRYADATDYVILSKKSVFGIDDEGILLRVGEEELLLMDSAIVDAASFPGAYLYSTSYVEELMQEAAVVNYTPTASVIGLIENDPNVVRAAAEYLSLALRNEIEGRLLQDAND